MPGAQIYYRCEVDIFVHLVELFTFYPLFTVETEVAYFSHTLFRHFSYHIQKEISILKNFFFQKFDNEKWTFFEKCPYTFLSIK